MSHRSSLGRQSRPLKYGLRDYVDYNAVKLPKYLRSLLGVRSPYHFAYYTLPSSIPSLTRFSVVSRQFPENGLDFV
jgi:hypothetical protein